MKKPSPNDATLLQDIDDALADDVLSDAYPLEEVAKSLDAAGADSREIMKVGVNHVAALKRKRRLAWQEDARRKAEAMSETVASRAPIANLSRPELLARLDQARNDRRFVEPVALAARNLTANSTDEELRQVLEEIEVLALLAGPKKDEGA